MLQLGDCVLLVLLIGMLRIQELCSSDAPRPDILERTLLMTTEVTGLGAEPDTGMPCILSGKSARQGM